LEKKRPKWHAAAGALLVGGTIGLVLAGGQLSWNSHGGETPATPNGRKAPHEATYGPVLQPSANSEGLIREGPQTYPVADANPTTSTGQKAALALPTAAAEPIAFATPSQRKLAPSSEDVLAQNEQIPPSATPDTTSAATIKSDEPGPYVDQLIDPNVAEQPVVEEQQVTKGLSRYGSGSAGIEYGYYSSKATGDADRTVTENGLGVSFRQATPNFGWLDFQAAITNQTDDPGPDVGSGDVLRLAQTDLPLTRRWFMDNVLGQTPAPAPANVAISYRLRLPAPLISGLATRASHDGTTVGAAAGDLGILRGQTFPVFESTTGSVSGVAATQQFNPHWGGGLQLWDVKDALVGTRIDSHTSLAGMVEYRDPVAKQLGQLHLLSNGGGTNGLWLDGETIRGRWQHNYGAFRLDPDLLWIDDTYAIPNDQQGMYWNGTYQTFRWGVRGGADFLETNIDNDPQLTGRKTTNLFANVAYRLSPRLNVDGALRFGRQRPGAGLASEDSDAVSVRSTVSYGLGNGTSFWTVGVTDLNNDSSPSTVSEIIWDYEWRIPQTRLRTGIEYQRNEQSNDTLSETLLRVIASRRFFDSRLGLDASYTAGVAGGGTTEEGRTSSLNLALDWRINRALELRLDLTQNKNVVELVNGSETRVTQRTVFLSVAYQFGWSSTRTTIGKGNAGDGQGRIGGTVFLDANRNGIQEPDEAGVPNVTVYLDRGFSVTTDARGRFEFWPVPAGDHTLQIALDNVPLPWGLVDESPRQVKVVPRDATQLDYGLTKINE